ncbi:CvfB family protein [Anaerosinus massiliensis]|uniref:CvfB family protein n=1 Tax=Massilibacillus massiliensis TaxID=1806837 RepID=UPI000AF6A10B|nr:S1-like domain-containing RNA-binding protein [Massilibacillus massiliensis]
MENNKIIKLKPSTVETLKVVRMSEMGAFLDAMTGNTSDDILLHKTQQIRPVEIGEEVEVFLYLDPKGRLTASMRIPKMKEGQIAKLKIINVSKDGAFVDVGAERGIFMPFAGMRGKVQIGEVVWAKLYRDKSGRLAVTMEVEDEIRRASKPAQVNIGDMIHGTVYNYTDQGAFIFTDERYIAFMDNGEITERPKVGEEITARVTFLREDGRINVSMRPIKEKAIPEDVENILHILNERGGKMPYSDSASPEVIKDKFNISKAAFKRALGSLMKSGKIEQRDGWTYLKDQS